MDSPLRTAAQAAEYLATTERHVQALWDRRELTATKVGRLVRFHIDDLNTYIENHRKGAAANA